MRYAAILDFKLRHSVRRGLNPAGILDLIKNPQCVMRMLTLHRFELTVEVTFSAIN